MNELGLFSVIGFIVAWVGILLCIGAISKRLDIQSERLDYISKRLDTLSPNPKK